MSEKKLHSTVQIARNLVDHLAEPINSHLKDLLEGVERGRNTPRDINKLLYEHENIRRWMEEQTALQNGMKNDDLRGGGYQKLAGNSTSVLASQKWVCPVNKRDHWMLVIQEGEPPPKCKIHEKVMIRESKQRG